jgi:hypothetical protein
VWVPVVDEAMDDTSTPSRGNPESAQWFRDRLAVLGLAQSELARRMIAAGDDRQFATILRSIQRMAQGQARVSGEMRALLAMLAEVGRLEADLGEQGRLAANLEASLKSLLRPNDPL